MRVRGLSFHVGSQVADPSKYVEAIDACRELMLDAGRAGGTALDVLDIGGGFPVAYGGRVGRDRRRSAVRSAASWPRCRRTCR